jgi:hypothetical protein
VHVKPESEPTSDAVGAGGPSSYQAFLLRMWQEHRTGQPVWRASLENPHTGERLGFAGLPELFAYLQAQAGSPAPASPAPTTDG